MRGKRGKNELKTRQKGVKNDLKWRKTELEGSRNRHGGREPVRQDRRKRRGVAIDYNHRDRRDRPEDISMTSKDIGENNQQMLRLRYKGRTIKTQYKQNLHDD